MTSKATPETKPWPWPIDLKACDRTPSLSDSERDGLRRAVERLQKSQNPWAKDISTLLERIMIPIWDVFAAVKTSEFNRQRTVNFLLKTMHCRQTSYWAWTREDWRDIFTTEPELNRGQYGRTDLMAVAYLLGGIRSFHDFGHLHHSVLAKRLFGEERITQGVQRIDAELITWGYSDKDAQHLMDALTIVLLLCESPRLEHITFAALDVCQREYIPAALQRYIVCISRVLAHFRIIQQPLTPLSTDLRPQTVTIAGVPPEWVHWCQRWKATTTMTSQAKRSYYYNLLQTGRWLALQHADITSPAQWTRELAAEYVASIRERKVGEFGTLNERLGERLGKPLTPASKINHLTALCTFFRDSQAWEWIPIRFDPRRYLRLPYSLRAQLVPNPRVIADDFWAKLLWAGLNLTTDDLPRRKGLVPFPFEMVHAVTMVWLFAGLREDELRRLRVGCVRWRQNLTPPAEADAICLLDVPVNKTGPAFTKPVSHLVGRAINVWEKLRPQQPLQLDPKTNEPVNYLFSVRAKHLGGGHVNNVIIPMLCRKAGLPEADARGPITSHRARSTIASQLANAREPMTLLELMQWLGHSSTKSTQHYVNISATRLTKSYTEAGYFDRNMRTIQVLIDQDAIRNRTATSGEPWKLYDLGHGYCSYDFFDQCAHRMACAKCAFYIPKESSRAQMLEAKANLLHMLQVIPLKEEERAAVEDGLAALTILHERLVDTPTPAGPTPRQLGQTFNVIALDDIR